MRRRPRRRCSRTTAREVISVRFTPPGSGASFSGRKHWACAAVTSTTSLKTSSWLSIAGCQIAIAEHRRLALTGSRPTGARYRRQRWNQSYFKGHEPVSQTSRHMTQPPPCRWRPEAYRVLSSFLAGLSAPTRSTFVPIRTLWIHVRGIAALHKISTNTTWARLRRARKTVLPQLAAWSANERNGTT